MTAITSSRATRVDDVVETTQPVHQCTSASNVKHILARTIIHTLAQTLITFGTNHSSILPELAGMVPVSIEMVVVFPAPL